MCIRDRSVAEFRTQCRNPGRSSRSLSLADWTRTLRNIWSISTIHFKNRKAKSTDVYKRQTLWYSLLEVSSWLIVLYLFVNNILTWRIPFFTHLQNFGYNVSPTVTEKYLFFDNNTFV